jgi:hypothetical protein
MGKFHNYYESAVIPDWAQHYVRFQEMDKVTFCCFDPFVICEYLASPEKTRSAGPRS